MVACIYCFRRAAQKIRSGRRRSENTPKGKVASWLRNDGLGDRPVAEIKAPEVLEVLRKIERRGRYDTARRARSPAGRVFKFAIATNRADRDPSADLAGALISPKVQHHAAILEPKAVGALLRAIDDLDGQPTTRTALQLLPKIYQLAACGRLKLFNIDGRTMVNGDS